MRISTRCRSTRWSWLAPRLALIVGLWGIAAAQAPVTRTEFSTDLLLALLGGGKAIEIELPDDVHAVHVVATQGDAVVIERSTDVGERADGRAASIAVSVGAVGPTLRCPLLVFIEMNLHHAGRASGGGMNATCMEIDEPVALRPALPGGFLAPSFEVDTWNAIAGFWPARIGPGAPRPTPDDTVVFHVYLATDDAPPPFEVLGITDR